MFRAEGFPTLNQSIPQIKDPPLNPTRLKVAGFVIGVLLVGLATAFHFSHINAIAVYSTGAVGGALIIGTAIWTVIDRIRKSKAHTPEEQKYEEEIYWMNKIDNENIEEIRNGEIDKRHLNMLLNWAARNGNVEIVTILIEKGADPTKTSNGEYTALHQAIQVHEGLDKAFEVVQVLLKHFPSLVHMTGRLSHMAYSFSPLHLACLCPGSLHADQQHTDAELIQFLLDQGADITLQDEEGNTPLHKAAEGTILGTRPPDIKVIELLVRAGSNLQTKNNAGKTAIQIAQKKYPEWFRQNQPKFQEILNSLQ